MNVEFGELEPIGTAMLTRFMPGATFVSARPLTGGVSAVVVAFDYVDTRGIQGTIVVRWHGENDLRRNPRLAADEFALLQALHRAGIPVPEPLFFDVSNAISPSPYLAIAFVEGTNALEEMDADEVVKQMARQLAAIHRLDLSETDLSFLTDQAKKFDERRSEPPEATTNEMGESIARNALAAADLIHSANRPVLLHGDYWPGNLLWKSGTIAAVIDWEDAALGDPLVDLANGRMEVLFAFGVAQMDAFTRNYCRRTQVDLTNLPYWDLFVAIGPVLRLHEWGLDPDVEATMIARHGEFVRQALQTLALRRNAC